MYLLAVGINTYSTGRLFVSGVRLKARGNTDIRIVAQNPHETSVKELGRIPVYILATNDRHPTRCAILPGQGLPFKAGAILNILGREGTLIHSRQ